MTGRALAVVLIALLVGVQVVRNAVVDGLAAAKPDIAAKFWGDHPAVELSLAMTGIARAARAGQPVPASALAKIEDASAKDPLAPEPFLVRGVQAQLAGDGATAQRAFEAAQWRDPRSLPAAYFLAERYFRTGDARRGLVEVAALARLSPGGAYTVGPYLAAYAASPRNWPALRSLFRAHPVLAEPALTTLASNVASVPAALALADPRQKVEDAHWLPLLLNTLVAAGQYERAQAIWAKASGLREPGEALIHDASFSDKASPPPFNWQLTSSTVGLSERQPGGRLHVLFYGQEDGILASQLLLLPPGTYRLSMQLPGGAARPSALSWSIWCDKAVAPIASVGLEVAAARGWRFTVPRDCPAQWLRLSGVSNDMPQQSDVSIAGLKLERARTDG